MKEIFNEHYRFLGDLITKSITLENLICELTINTYDTNAMEVKVIPSQGSLLFVFNSIKHNEPIKLKSKEMRDEIILDVGMPSLEINSNTGHTGSFMVFSCTIINHLNDEITANKVHCSAFIPHSAIFKRRRPFTNHYSRGILAGWSEKKEKDLPQDSWQKEEFAYKTDIGFLKIIPSFVFGEFSFDENKDKAKFLIDQTYLSLVIKQSEAINFSFEEKFIKNLNDFLKILSFLEGEYLEWKSVTISYFYGDKLLKEKKIYSRIKEMFDPDKNRNHYQLNHKIYQNIIDELFVSLQKQETSTYNEIIRIIDRYLIASTQKIIDTQLIYWHSCLDIIIKHFNSIGKSFSHKLIDCCIKNNIAWLDLFPDVTIESLNNRNEFLINKIRNDILHHGIYPIDYNIETSEKSNFLFSVTVFQEKIIKKR